MAFTVRIVHRIIQRTDTTQHSTYVWTGHKLCVLLILTAHSLLACGTIRITRQVPTVSKYRGHILEHNIFIHTTVKTSNFRSQLRLKIVYCQTVLQLWVTVFWNVMLVTGGLVPGIPSSVTPSKYQKPVPNTASQPRRPEIPVTVLQEPPPSAHL